MAVTVLNSGINQEKGITYSAITDSSVDWTGITNSTYFYDKATDLPYYKNASGTVISLFEEGGSGADTFVTGGTYSGSTIILNRNDGNSVDVTGITSSNIYTADGTLSGNRTVNLNSNTLKFEGGQTYIDSGSFNPLVINRKASGTQGNGIDFNAYNSSNAETNFARIIQVATDATAGSEDGGLWFRTMIAGVLRTPVVLDNREFLIDAVNFTDNFFRIKDGGIDCIKVNTNNQTYIESGSHNPLVINRKGAGTIGNGIDFNAYNSASSEHNFARIIQIATSTTAGSENGGLQLRVSDSGTITTKMTIKNDSTIISEKLELSTTTDGMLMPRLTTAQKNAISSPDTNLMVFDTDLSSLQRYNGSAWVAMAAGYGVIEVIKDSDNGNPTFYSDLQSALDTCKTAGSNNIIKLHSDISLSAQININTGGSGAGNGYQFKGLLIDGNGFEITFDDTGTDNAFDINLTLVQEIILNNLRILRINGTGTHYALDIDGVANGNQKLSMSNSYIYSDNGGAAFIQDITGNMSSLGGSKFESDGSINTLTFRSYNMFFKDFITTSNGTGDAILNYSNGEITKFYCENTSTGRAYDSQANSIATFFSAKSNSGDAVYANVASSRVSEFYATSTSGNAFHGRNATNFHLKTGNNVALQAGVYANLKNGYVENNSTSAAMDTNTIEYCHNVTFVNLGSGYGVDIQNTIGYNNKITNCTFISKGGVGAFLDTIAANLYNCVFISKYNNASGHACEVNMNGNILMGCSFIVENNSANCIYSNSAVSAKVGNCNFDNATTPINANITLDSLEIDAFGNVTT